jgi:biopolymer transport protein TolR
MVVTPMLQKTHQVDLASVNDPRDMKDADKDDAIVVAVTRDGSLFLGNSKIKKEEITGQIKDQLANKLDKTVYVKSDARAKYGDVVAVVDEIRSAGVDSLGLLTEKTKALAGPSAPATNTPKAAGGS